MIFAGYLLWNIVARILRCMLTEEASQKASWSCSCSVLSLKQELRGFEDLGEFAVIDWLG
jgi:hypothetical protein